MTGQAVAAADIALLPDAGPLITLAYADALDVLMNLGWTVMLVDMVLHQVTRKHTPTSEKLAAWATAARIPILPTHTFAHFGWHAIRPWRGHGARSRPLAVAPTPPIGLTCTTGSVLYCRFPLRGTGQ